MQKFKKLKKIFAKKKKFDYYKLNTRIQIKKNCLIFRRQIVQF
jgi:hypothetical protein